MKVATASLETKEMTIEDLKTGDSLIPMSAFKQVDKSPVFAIPDDYIPTLKNFLWIAKQKDANGKEFTTFYCKGSFAKEFVAKIREGNSEATKKFLKESMVSLEDYNSWQHNDRKGNKRQ